MVLHIVLGGSARGGLSAVGVPAETIFTGNDDLSFGRLLPLGDAGAWDSLRQPRSLGDAAPPRRCLAYHDFLGHLEEIRQAEEIRLWLGPIMSEQLFLAWIVALFDFYGLDHSVLRVVDFSLTPYGNGALPRSCGTLSPEQVRELLLAPLAPLSTERLTELLTLWHAVTAPDPTTLVALQDQTTGPLNQVISHCLSRYPDAGSGLGDLDETLLWLAGRCSRLGKAIGVAIGDSCDHLDWCSDRTLIHRMIRMADRSIRRPLLILRGDLTRWHVVNHELTADGKEPLAGKFNHVDANGINEWIGGVRLDSRDGPVWFRSGSFREDGPIELIKRRVRA